MNSPVIKIQNISYDYSEENGYRKKIINDVSIDIESGEIIFLFGKNNSANNVLLKIISGLIKPDSGDVVSEKKIVFIPSEPSSFPWLNVKENIVYNLKNYDENQCEKIIKLVGLNGYENHFPDNKSFGFRFRISVARAIMNGAEVLVLDEPFAFMDSLTKKECKELLRKINSDANITVIFTSSDILGAVNLTDNVLVISDDDDGRVVKMAINKNSKYDSILELDKILNL